MSELMKALDELGIDIALVSLAEVRERTRDVERRTIQTVAGQIADKATERGITAPDLRGVLQQLHGEEVAAEVDLIIMLSSLRNDVIDSLRERGIIES